MFYVSCASGNQAPQHPRHLEYVGLPHLRSLNPPVGGRMIDRHANRLMVTYLYLELAAMYESTEDQILALRHHLMAWTPTATITLGWQRTMSVSTARRSRSISQPSGFGLSCL